MYLPPLLKDFFLRSGILSIVKLIGALGRITLFRLVGSEGIGLYQMAYAYYGLLITIITGGFASAVSLATAKDIQRGKQLFHFSLYLLAILGSSMGLLSYYCAPFVAELFGEKGLVRPIQFLAPAILLVPILSLMRGFLQGLQRYAYIALSELIEQVVRVVAMVFLTGLLMQKGLTEAVGGALFGAVLGAFIAFLFLLAPLLLPFPTVQMNHHSLPTSIPVFIMSCISIMGARIILPASDFIDSILVPNRLFLAGYSVQEATEIYGKFFGIVATVVFVPTLITGSISHIMLPRLTIAWETLNISGFIKKIKVAFNTTLLWGLSSSFFLVAYSHPISTLVIGNESLAQPIQYLSLAPLFASLRELSTTILWTMNVKGQPLKGLILATIFSSLINFFVIGIPGYSIAGIILGILCFEITSLTFNLTSLIRAIHPQKIGLSIVREIVVCISFLSCIHFAISLLYSHIIPIGSTFIQDAIMGLTFFILFPLYIYGHLTYIQRKS